MSDLLCKWKPIPNCLRVITVLIGASLFCAPLLGQFGATVQYFAHFGVGGGIATDFTIHNPGNAPVDVTIEVFDSQGAAFTSRQVTVGPGATETVSFEGEEQLTTGWARLTSPGKFAATEFFKSVIGNVGVLPGMPSNRLKVFAFLEGGTRTGFAVANPSSTEAHLTVSRFDESGNSAGDVNITVPAFGHRAIFLDEAPVSMTADGSAEITSDSPVVAVTLRLDGTLLAGVGVIVPGLPIRAELNDVSPNIIAGASKNSVTDAVVGATISGGGVDQDDRNNKVTDDYGTIGGGRNNLAGDDAEATDDAIGASVGGGTSNQATGKFSIIGGGAANFATGGWSTVGGGSVNQARGDSSFVGGGVQNWALGNWSTAGGGSENHAIGSVSTIGGGSLNEATGAYSTVPGGRLNVASGIDSLAAGRRAQASHNGSFVWADSTDADFASTGENQFRLRASGGATVFSDSAATTGVDLAAGSGSWSTLSDAALKENFVAVDTREVLRHLSSINLQTWNYMSQEKTIRHIGPTAQDFMQAFQVGENNRHISTVDADGVALAAIQGLYRIVQEKDAKIAGLEARLARLENLLADKGGR